MGIGLGASVGGSTAPLASFAPASSCSDAASDGLSSCGAVSLGVAPLGVAHENVSRVSAVGLWLGGRAPAVCLLFVCPVGGEMAGGK